MIDVCSCCGKTWDSPTWIIKGDDNGEIVKLCWNCRKPGSWRFKDFFLSESRRRRIEGAREKYHGDIAQPWEYSKPRPGVKNKGWQPNPDFIKANPEKVKDYFDEKERKEIT